MDETYDVIVLGTGLKECILSGMLSVDGMKVLHMDRNDYYGGESASLSLSKLYEKMRPGQKPPDSLGSSKDYNIDMVPKFMMANGLLVRALVKMGVEKYLEFKAVDGSFVYMKESSGAFGGLFGKGGATINKVPATDMEALNSPLLTLFEKNRARLFFKYVQEYVEEDPRTHNKLDLARMPMRDLFAKFGLEASTVDFVGHALALHRDDAYLSQPALQTVQKVKLYHDSLTRFDGMKAPYIYPLYGLGELPQAFARLSAVYGGTYMLNRPGAEVVYDATGAAVGVRVGGETAACKMVVGDGSYFPGKSRVVGRVVRAVCLLSHPIPNTGDAASIQIILPQKQVGGRSSDVYIFCCSASHSVAPKGRYVAFVSTTAETANPEAELALGLSLLGPIDEKFVSVSEITAPTNDPAKDRCFITAGYDPTTHFQTTMEDVLATYTRITGKTYDLGQA